MDLVNKKVGWGRRAYSSDFLTAGADAARVEEHTLGTGSASGELALGAEGQDECEKGWKKLKIRGLLARYEDTSAAKRRKISPAS